MLDLQGCDVFGFEADRVDSFYLESYFVFFFVPALFPVPEPDGDLDYPSRYNETHYLSARSSRWVTARGWQLKKGRGKGTGKEWIGQLNRWC
jgi:hypothetical protein